MAAPRGASPPVIVADPAWVGCSPVPTKEHPCRAGAAGCGRVVGAMATHPTAHRVLLPALVLAVGAASPCLAKLAEEDFSTEDGSYPSGLVRSLADEFTDAIQLVVLHIRGEESGSVRVEYHKDGLFTHSPFADRAIATRKEDHKGGLFAVSFVDGKIGPPLGYPVEVTYRIDALEAVTLPATVLVLHAQARVSEAWLEELFAAVLDAETIIYRVGPKGRILRLSLPAEMPELVAEFRRRVVELAGAEESPPLAPLRGEEQPQLPCKHQSP